MVYYYIDTIEQVKAKDDNDMNINEYGKRDIQKLSDGTAMPLDQVLSKFYKKLSDVSADLITIGEDKNHYYMDIKIVNSDGKIEKKDMVGTRQEVEPKPEVEG
jgi:hypothetical protein